MNHIVLEISSWTKEIPDIVYREILSHVVFFFILSFHPPLSLREFKTGRISFINILNKETQWFWVNFRRGKIEGENYAVHSGSSFMAL